MGKASSVLNTIEISHELERMMDSSYKYLVFVSPYIRITDRLKAKLSQVFSQLDACYFVHRKNELPKGESDWISSFANVHLIGVENLHAKIYLNDKQCLITSMNFYEYSQINNYEIGVVIDKNREKDDYQRAVEEVLMMAKLSPEYERLFNVLETDIDFSMRKLFNKLKQVSGKYSKFSYENDQDYLDFCADARRLVDFHKSEFYQDGMAILRSANIGRERFEKIFNKLK